MFHEVRVPVLVSEDTIYQREDHSKRLLLFGRPPLPGQPFNRLFPKRPDPALFYDTFASVIPVQEAYQQTGTGGVLPPPANPQPFFLFNQSRPPWVLLEEKFASVIPLLEAYSQTPTTGATPPQPSFLFYSGNRPRPELFDDHSLETGKTDHPYPHVIQIGIGLYPYSFEVADLNSDPWIEWVPPHPPMNLYPFRQLYVQIPTAPRPLNWWKSKNWDIEAEPIWNVPSTPLQLFNQFRWQIVIPTLPNVVGDTQAVAISVMNAAGFFNLTINLLPSISVPAGIVISQLPLPGPVGSFTIPVIINVSIGFQPPGTQIMPNVVGVILREAIQFLQDAGVYQPQKIGYFGTDPISIIWLPKARGQENAAYVGDFGIVHAQNPAAGTAIIPNSPIVLTVSSYPDSVSFQ